MRTNLFILLFYSTYVFSQEINVKLFDCELSIEESTQIQRVYELERDYYHSIFGRRNSTVNIEVYGDFKEYKRYQNLISKSSKSNSGFTSSITNAAIVYKKKDYINVINHELSHLILHERIINSPKWLDEGMAEYFEYFQFKENQYQLRVQFQKTGRMIKWLDKGAVNLKKFLKQTNADWNSNNNKPNFYSSSVSYSLVLFLQEKEPELLKQILLNTAAGKPVLKTIKKSHTGGVEALELGFEKYCRERNESPIKVLKF